MSTQARTLIIIPTYNERGNIAPFMEAIRSACPEVDLLIVDDNSPDKTAELVNARMATDPKVHLLSRAGKQGLGRAYIAGFQWGLQHGFEILAQMDADFSHRPPDMRKILDSVNQTDFSIGSRWTKGGGTQNWGFGRKLISRGGSFYARTILGFPVRDWTGGMNVWKRKVLEGIDYKSVKSNGYSFQIEMKYRALKSGYKSQEIPILFEDRKVGQSKMSMRIVFEALLRVWSFRFQKQ